MQITIAHLYYDLLNLYGESGNILALKNYLLDQKVKVKVENISLEDNFEFSNYDFVYIGAGTENNLLIALKNLRKYKKELTEYIESGGFFLATGNSIDLFGKTINIEDEVEALNIFSYVSKKSKTRIVSESIYSSKFVKSKVIGFQNQSTTIENNTLACFNVISGFGMTENSEVAGIQYKNFLGTYLVGPLLVRNPDLLEYVIKNLVLFKNKHFKLKKSNLKFQKEAYKEYMKNSI